MFSVTNNYSVWNNNLRVWKLSFFFFSIFILGRSWKSAPPLKIRSTLFLLTPLYNWKQLAPPRLYLEWVKLINDLVVRVLRCLLAVAIQPWGRWTLSIKSAQKRFSCTSKDSANPFKGNFTLVFKSVPIIWLVFIWWEHLPLMIKDLNAFMKYL